MEIIQYCSVFKKDTRYNYSTKDDIPRNNASKMVGVNKQSPVDDATYLRKIRKPMVERQRRERMNQSITQLRALIDDTVKQNVAPMTRVDKADILDLTVCHLTNLRRRQQRVAMPTTDSAAYASGFQDCAREAASFLLSKGLLDERRLNDLSRHLQSKFDRTTASCLPSNGHVSTPHQPQQCLRMLEGTPYQLKKVSPIQPQGYCSIYSTPSGSRVNDRTFDSGNSFTSSPFPVSFVVPGMTRVPLVGNGSLPTDITASSSEQTSGYGSLLTSTDDSITCSHGDGRTVSIGTGSENKIGHVISDPTWRPW